MSEFVLPPSARLVDPISDSECSSLGNNTGLDVNDGETTCQALQQRLMPLLAQIMSDISSGVMTIYANDDSKCDDNADPTLASMMSRIYRVSQAFTCILCQYDPTLSNMLMAGSYPQVLMGKQTESGYPGWVNPDTAPIAGSPKVVTSGGVYTAIQNAILSVWHMWKGNGSTAASDGNYAYLVNDNVADIPTTGNVNTDWSIVYNTTSHAVTTYKWNGSSWVQKGTFTASQMQDFSVIHVEKGEWEDKGLYWFDTGWNLLDADLGELEQRMDALEQQYHTSVVALDNTTNYKLGVVADATAASAVPSETGVTKIIFISGSN